MKKTLLLVLPLLLSTFLATLSATLPAKAEPSEETSLASVAAPRTVQIASFSAGPGPKAYRVRISNCGQNISQAKIKVLGNSFLLRSVTFFFQDRSTKSLSLNQSFAAGYESPWFDISSLRANAPCVTSFALIGNASDSRAPARVMVFGTRTN